MNRVLCFVFCFLVIAGHAQKGYSLQQCIDSALKNYIPVRRVGLQTEVAEVNWKQSRSNLLPDLTGDVSQMVFSGRSIDPSTNSFVNQNYNGGTYGLNSGVTLFNGLSLRNRVKQNAFAYEASRMEQQQSRDELVLNVILAYLSVLSNEDQLQATYQQVSTTQATMERLNVLNSQGAVRPSDVTDLKGQLMNDQLNALTARNILESSKLQLLQLMNKNYDSTLKLERIDGGEFLEQYHKTPADIFQSSLDQFSQVKAAELRTRSASYGLKATKGQLYPQFSLGAGINTRYSSIAQNTGGGKMSYTDQLKNFKNSYLGVGVSIPLFNRFFNRNQVRLAAIQLKDDELAEAGTKQQLRQQIDQAYLNMMNAYERYKVLAVQVEAYDQSYKAAEVRFKAGVGTSVDYLVAKERLDRATLNLINARYDFVLRKRILDYYSGSIK
jgi:outer membrane protein